MYLSDHSLPAPISKTMEKCKKVIQSLVSRKVLQDWGRGLRELQAPRASSLWWFDGGVLVFPLCLCNACGGAVLPKGPLVTQNADLRRCLRHRLGRSAPLLLPFVRPLAASSAAGAGQRVAPRLRGRRWPGQHGPDWAGRGRRLCIHPPDAQTADIHARRSRHCCPPRPLHRQPPCPTTRDAWEGGGVTPPPPSREPCLCPAAVPLTASASLNGICNRRNRPQPLRQPPPTACLTASGAASEVPSLLMHPGR